MTLHADYARERLGWETIETPEGFVQFSSNAAACFVQELYVVPEHRGKRVASELLDRVRKWAVERDLHIMYATICPYAAGNSEALARALKFGFRLVDVDTARKLVVLAKDIQHG